MITGYAIGRRIGHSCRGRRNPPPGCIHHSGGSQYAAQAYRALSEHGLVGSMARRGNPLMESFMKTLKVEGVYPMAFESEEDVAALHRQLQREAPTLGTRLPEPQPL